MREPPCVGELFQRGATGPADIAFAAATRWERQDSQDRDSAARQRTPRHRVVPIPLALASVPSVSGSICNGLNSIWFVASGRSMCALSSSNCSAL
jgi:hypothetical protein